MRRGWLAVVAAVAIAGPVLAQEGPSQIGRLTTHDFAAKWMMQQDDLADLGRYSEANRTLLAGADTRPRLVLMGDSILFHWELEDFPAPASLAVVNRGIPGQNTSQMLLRFEDDVVSLHPAAVVILAGTNDLRAYVGPPAAAGPAILAQIRRNVTAMADIAAARGIEVVLCAVPPVGVDMRIARDPATILRVNDWLKSFAAEWKFGFVDFHAVLVDPAGHLRTDLAKPDGIHPTPAGYHAMWPPLEAQLAHLRTAR